MSSTFSLDKFLAGEYRRFQARLSASANVTNNNIQAGAGASSELVLVPYAVQASAAGLTNARFRLYFHDGSSEQGDILGNSTALQNVGLNFSIAPQGMPLARAGAGNWNIGCQIAWDSGSTLVTVTVYGLFLPKLTA